MLGGALGCWQGGGLRMVGGGRGEGEGIRGEGREWLLWQRCGYQGSAGVLLLLLQAGRKSLIRRRVGWWRNRLLLEDAGVWKEGSIGGDGRGEGVDQIEVGLWEAAEMLGGGSSGSRSRSRSRSKRGGGSVVDIQRVAGGIKADIVVEWLRIADVLSGGGLILMRTLVTPD